MTKRPLKSHLLAALAAGLMCLAAALPMSAQSGCNITMPDVQGSGGGTVTVPVSLTNPIGIFSMQIEVFLPDGVDIVGMERAARIEGATNFNYAQQDQYTADEGLRYRRVFINNLIRKLLRSNHVTSTLALFNSPTMFIFELIKCGPDTFRHFAIHSIEFMCCTNLIQQTVGIETSDATQIPLNLLWRNYQCWYKFI